MVRQTGNPQFLSEQQVAERQGRVDWRGVPASAALAASISAGEDVDFRNPAAQALLDSVGTGRIFRHTKSNDPILGVNKITYSHFLKTVWVLSNTNLHIKDFEAEYGEQLKRIFHPVPLRNGGAA